MCFRRTIGFALAGLTLTLLMGQGCPPASAPPDDPNVTTVDMRNIAFMPPAVTIKTGQTVRWVNRDLVPHTVTSGSPGDPNIGSEFQSGNILLNGTFEHTFNEPGVFVYFCEIHPTIMFDATVTVED